MLVVRVGIAVPSSKAGVKQCAREAVHVGKEVFALLISTEAVILKSFVSTS